MLWGRARSDRCVSGPWCRCVWGGAGSDFGHPGPCIYSTTGHCLSPRRCRMETPALPSSHRGRGRDPDASEVGYSRPRALIQAFLLSTCSDERGPVHRRGTGSGGTYQTEPRIQTRPDRTDLLNPKQSQIWGFYFRESE